MADRGRLTNRLKRIRETRQDIPAPGEKTKRSPGVPEKGREDRVAGLPAEWERLGPHTYRRKITVTPGYAGKAPHTGSLLCRGIPGRNLLFFDTETTGLSGGAGNYIFLFGAAKLRENRLELVQIFLADYPGEPDFLSAVGSEMDPEAVLVSYNGKGFDSHLLQTRYIMNGIRPAVHEHVDLLPVVRRLWRKRLPGCSLSSVEEHILNIRRSCDIPGYAVPLRYFQFLKEMDFQLIHEIIEHNTQDIISLALLYSHIDRLLELEDPRTGGADPYGLGRLLMEKGVAAGEVILKNSAAAGGHEALKYLSLSYRRRGNLSGAAVLWEQAWNEHRSLFAGVELAKYLEHALKDYPSALSVVGGMLKLVSPSSPTAENLKYRKLRLERKAARGTGRRSGPHHE